MKEGVLTAKANGYLKRLQRFEEKHKMKSADFFKAFTAGELGDDTDWFDWIFAYEAHGRIGGQKETIGRLSL